MASVTDGVWHLCSLRPPPRPYSVIHQHDHTPVLLLPYLPHDIIDLLLLLLILLLLLLLCNQVRNKGPHSKEMLVHARSRGYLSEDGAYLGVAFALQPLPIPVEGE